MVTITVACRYCGNQDAVRRKELSTNGNQPHQRTGYKCEHCQRSFQLRYTHKAHEPGIKEKVIDMALNGSGIRDTARVLKIQYEHGDEYAKKKATQLLSVNPAYTGSDARRLIRLEADEQWSYVQNKRNPRWL